MNTTRLTRLTDLSRLSHTRPTRRPGPGRRLRRGLAGLVLGGLAVAGVTACDPNAAANCAVDCIEFVSANAAGDQVMVAAPGAARAEDTEMVSAPP